MENLYQIGTDDISEMVKKAIDLLNEETGVKFDRDNRKVEFGDFSDSNDYESEAEEDSDDNSQDQAQDPNAKKDTHKITFNGMNSANIFRVHLDKSNIDAYALYNFLDGNLSKIIKIDKFKDKSKLIDVDWLNTKKAFLDYSSNHAVNFMRTISRNMANEDNDLAPGYLTYPQSSADFNKDFCTTLTQKMPEVQLVQDYIMKNMCGIAIDEYMAIALGCDASDVAKMKEWIAKQTAIGETVKIRKEIKTILNKVANDVAMNHVFHNYQYVTNPKFKKGYKKGDLSNLADKMYGVNGAYLDTRDWNGWKEGTTWTGWQGPGLRSKEELTNKSGKSVKAEISADFLLDTIDLEDKMKKIIEIYGNFENAYNQIEDQRKKDIADKKYNTIRINGGVKTWDDEPESAIRQKHKAVADALNATVDDQGNVVDAKWEIKSLADWGRKILYKLMCIDETKDDFASPDDKEHSIIFVFDDNMAGNTTMDNTCVELRKAGWKHIVPFVLSKMPTSNKVRFDNSPEKYADRTAVAQTQLRGRGRPKKGEETKAKYEKLLPLNGDFVGNQYAEKEYEIKGPEDIKKLRLSRLRINQNLDFVFEIDIPSDIKNLKKLALGQIKVNAAVICGHDNEEEYLIDVIARKLESLIADTKVFDIDLGNKFGGNLFGFRCTEKTKKEIFSALRMLAPNLDDESIKRIINKEATLVKKAGDKIKEMSLDDIKNALRTSFKMMQSIKELCERAIDLIEEYGDMKMRT